MDDEQHSTFTRASSIQPWSWVVDATDHDQDLAFAHRQANANARNTNRPGSVMAAASILNLQGVRMTSAPKHRRRGWQRTSSPIGVHVPPERRSKSAMQSDPTYLTDDATAASPLSQTLPLRPLRPNKIDLSRLERGSGVPSPARVSPHHSVSQVQPYLGPQLKKALAKQGMAMQRLSLEPDEWDTMEVASMLGSCYASKKVLS
jgi:hypothetical protein